MTDNSLGVAASLSLYRFVLGIAVFYLALELNENINYQTRVHISGLGLL